MHNQWGRLNRSKIAPQNICLGRMLIALLLSLSRYLKQNQAASYRWFEPIPYEGDSVDWFRFFLTGVLEIAEDATQTAPAP